MTERELLHKWLGGESGIIEDEIARLGVPQEMAKGVILRILHACERRRPYSWPTDPSDEISLCAGCHCMTKTIMGHCGKCQAPKTIQNLGKTDEIYAKPDISIQVNPKSHHYMEQKND
jgi:hypothetical protein